MVVIWFQNIAKNSLLDVLVTLAIFLANFIFYFGKAKIFLKMYIFFLEEIDYP